MHLYFPTYQKYTHLPQLLASFPGPQQAFLSCFWLRSLADSSADSSVPVSFMDQHQKSTAYTQPIAALSATTWRGSWALYSTCAAVPLENGKSQRWKNRVEAHIYGSLGDLKWYWWVLCMRLHVFSSPALAGNILFAYWSFHMLYVVAVLFLNPSPIYLL